ncbi:IQ and ubiquitin-like domain-containing protein [Huso huso]|uniref:IQ and ubiquitin-like domain-containing protein n=1 Tax=Huso huso TaxID=61971 RepID=A0ABR0ZD09_HUSHU
MPLIVREKSQHQQVTYTTSTQITKTGCYVSNTTNTLISPGKYFTADEYHYRRLKAVIVIQTYARRWHAMRLVKQLSHDRMVRLDWEKKEELRKKKEKEDRLKREYERRMHPKTKEDFDLLYHALESKNGEERKAALCALLEQGTQLIASIGRHKLDANEENIKNSVQTFLEKVPQYTSQLQKNIYCPGCRRCRSYLCSTEFSLTANSCTIGRCHQCNKLDNVARQREDLNKYKNMLTQLRQAEAEYDKKAKIAFLLQERDLQYLLGIICATQSALSAWDDLYDLVMVQWNKYFEWSPWNCILLTKEEAAAHLKLDNVEQAYGVVFIRKMKHKHTLANKYFSQIPAMAQFLHSRDSQPAAPGNDLLVTKPAVTQA